jgi:hypothetical protein
MLYSHDCMALKIDNQGFAVLAALNLDQLVSRKVGSDVISSM